VPPERRATRYFSKNRPETSHGEEGCEELTFATIERIRGISAGIGQPMATVALAWLLHQPGVTAVLAGGRRPDQIRENARAGDLKLAPEILTELTQATEDLKQKLGPNQDMYMTASQSRIV
jgi:aryl-alcohol dehydrogenase-like predicted oxidoreductase